MAVQNIESTKVSELPSQTDVADTDVLIYNHNGITSKIKFSDLMTVINSKVKHDTTAINNRLSTLESNYSALSSAVSDNTGTINNIVTAAFNLIEIDKTN